MRKFVAGVVFSSGMYLFGKCSYELGKLHEKEHHRKELVKLLNVFKEMNNVVEKVKEETEETEEESE